jgi:hypothetical protein
MEDNQTQFMRVIDTTPKHRLVIPAAYEAILGQLKLSHGEAARLLGVAPRSSQRWVSGTREVSATAYGLLVLLRDFNISPGEANRHFSQIIDQTPSDDSR